jgi:alpha-mannosidase
VVVPTGIDAAFSLAEQPFDVVSRPVALPDLDDYPGEKPTATHPQLSFAAVTDGRLGMAVANRGMLEYEVTDDPTRSIALTLLRCTDRLYELFFAEAEDLIIPGAQCLGTYDFDYSLIPFAGDLQQVILQSRAFASPLRAMPHGRKEEETFRDYVFPGRRSSLPASHAFVKVEPPDVLLSAVKKREGTDSLIVRVWNASEEPRRARIRIDIPGRHVESASLVSLAEERIADLPATSGVLELELGKKSIVSVEVRLGRMP